MWNRILGIVPVVAAVCLSATTTLAGGWGFFFDLPRPDADARLKDAVLIAHVAGCHAPGTRVTFTLFGWTDGKRITRQLVPIEIQDALGQVTYGIRREWPEAGGRWAVVGEAINPSLKVPIIENGKNTGRTRPASSRLLVPIEADGSPAIRPTPGAKYDHYVLSIYASSREILEKEITRYLSGQPRLAVRTATR